MLKQFFRRASLKSHSSEKRLRYYHPLACMDFQKFWCGALIWWDKWENLHKPWTFTLFAHWTTLKMRLLLSKGVTKKLFFKTTLIGPKSRSVYISFKIKSYIIAVRLKKMEVLSKNFCTKIFQNEFIWF